MFAVHEIPSFTQDDLNELDVMMLDTWNEVYLWIGREASDREKEMARDIAKEYIRCAPAPRKPEEIVLHTIVSGEEGLKFRSYFREWREARRDIAAEVEVRRRDRIQGLEDENQKPASPLMAEYFQKLNERMGIDAADYREGMSDEEEEEEELEASGANGSGSETRGGDEAEEEAAGEVAEPEQELEKEQVESPVEDGDAPKATELDNSAEASGESRVADTEPAATSTESHNDAAAEVDRPVEGAPSEACGDASCSAQLNANEDAAKEEVAQPEPVGDAAVVDNDVAEEQGGQVS